MLPFSTINGFSVGRITLIITLLILEVSGLAQSQSSGPFKQLSQFESEQEFFRIHPELVERKVKKEKGVFTVSFRNSSARQILKSEIPTHLNSFIFSPLHETFVGFEETEGRSDKLFFFDMNGKLLSSQTIDVYPVVSYSADGQFVIVFNSFGREILVFRKNGTPFFKGDYIDLIDDDSQVLYNVLVSENGSELLINAGDNVHVVNAISGTKLFQARTGRVLSGSFMSDRGKLLLSTSRDQTPMLDVVVMSKSDGEILGKISNLSKVFLTKSGFVTLVNLTYREYEVR